MTSQHSNRRRDVETLTTMSSGSMCNSRQHTKPSHQLNPYHHQASKTSENHPLSKHITLSKSPFTTTNDAGRLVYGYTTTITRLKPIFMGGGPYGGCLGLSLQVTSGQLGCYPWNTLHIRSRGGCRTYRSPNLFAPAATYFRAL